MFRLQDKTTGLWYEALDEDIEIIPLAEDEIMAQLRAPRLPGF